MKKTKFDPVYHSSVVRNFRELYKRKYGEASSLTDERIWDLFEEYFFDENSDEATVAAMREAK